MLNILRAAIKVLGFTATWRRDWWTPASVIINDLSALFLWVATPCGPVGRYKSFAGTF